MLFALRDWCGGEADMPSQTQFGLKVPRRKSSERIAQNLRGPTAKQEQGVRVSEITA